MIMGHYLTLAAKRKAPADAASQQFSGITPSIEGGIKRIKIKLIQV
jgi:hypothetical protein